MTVLRCHHDFCKVLSLLLKFQKFKNIHTRFLFFFSTFVEPYSSVSFTIFPWMVVRNESHSEDPPRLSECQHSGFQSVLNSPNFPPPRPIEKAALLYFGGKCLFSTTNELDGDPAFYELVKPIAKLFDSAEGLVGSLTSSSKWFSSFPMVFLFPSKKLECEGWREYGS